MRSLYILCFIMTINAFINPHISYFSDIMRCYSSGDQNNDDDEILLNYSRKKALKEDKQGYPIVLLHGLLGSSRNFRTIENMLQEALNYGHEIISFDARNHGLSPKQLPMSYELMAEDVMRTLDYLNVKRAHVVGHSMGGKTASMCCLMFPEQFSSVAVLDMSPIEYSVKDFEYVQRVIETLHGQQHLLQAPGGNVVGDILRSSSNAVLANSNDDLLEAFLRSSLKKRADASLEWIFDIDTIHANMHQFRQFVIPSSYKDACFDKPALILKGGASQYVRSRHLSSIQTLFPNFYIFNIRDAGHWLHAEKPKEVVERLALLVKASDPLYT